MTTGRPWFIPCTLAATAIEVTVRQDTDIYAPAECKIEVRKATGTIWREHASPAEVWAGQHVRVTQRSQA